MPFPRATVECVERETPEFISPLAVASKFSRFKSGLLQRVEQENMYKTRITDLDDLKHRIKTEWAKLDHAIIATAICQWRRRLSACTRAGDGH